MKALFLAAFLVVLGAARPTDACTLTGVNPVVFGAYDVYSNSDVSVLGGVKYICVIGLNIRVDLSTGSSGSYAMRKMQRVGGGDSLQYQLYVDSAKTQVWGDANNNGTSTYGPFIGLLVATTIPIYAVIPKKQNVQTGTYTDTVVVTFNY